MSISKINAYRPISFKANTAVQTEDASKQKKADVKKVAVVTAGSLAALGIITYAVVHNKKVKLPTPTLTPQNPPDNKAVEAAKEAIAEAVNGKAAETVKEVAAEAATSKAAETVKEAAEEAVSGKVIEHSPEFAEKAKKLAEAKKAGRYISKLELSPQDKEKAKLAEKLAKTSLADMQKETDELMQEKAKELKMEPDEFKKMVRKHINNGPNSEYGYSRTTSKAKKYFMTDVKKSNYYNQNSLKKLQHRIQTVYIPEVVKSITGSK